MEKYYWYENPNMVQRIGSVFQAYGMGFEANLFLSQTIFNPELIIWVGKLELLEELKSKAAKAPAEVMGVFDTTYLLLRISESRRNLKRQPIFSNNIKMKSSD